MTAGRRVGIIPRAMDAAPKPAAVALPHAGELVIYDLEYTAWPGSRERDWSGPGEHREVIQIGAVRLGAAELDERGAFEQLVLPRMNPRLSPYITDLTGITDADLAARGVAVADAIAAFAAFARGAALVGSFGEDDEVLHETLALNGLADAALPDGLADIAPAIMCHVAAPGEQLSSSDLPGRFGLPMTGQAHDALDDARAVALALRTLRRQGKV